jgi:serine/threonine protein kinase
LLQIHNGQGSTLLKKGSIPANNQTMTSIDFVLKAPEGLAFALNISMGLQAHLVVNLEFTLDGVADATRTQPVCGIFFQIRSFWFLLIRSMLQDDATNDAYVTVRFDGLTDLQFNPLSFDQSRTYTLVFFFVFCFYNTNFLISFGSSQSDPRTQIDLDAGIVVLSGSTILVGSSFLTTAIRLRLHFPSGRHMSSNIRRAVGSNLVLLATPGSNLFAETVITLGAEEDFAALSDFFSVRDVFPPVWSGCPDNQFVTLSDNSATVQVVWDEPSVSDSSGILTQSVTHEPGSLFGFTEFNLGIMQVSYSATDVFGNVGLCVFNVTVYDDMLPTATCPPDITLTLDPFTNETSLSNFTATNMMDNSGVTRFRCETLAENKKFGIGSYTIASAVFDGTNTNFVSCNTVLTVEDKTEPTFNYDCIATTWIVKSEHAGTLVNTSWALDGYKEGRPLGLLDNVGIRNVVYKPEPNKVLLAPGTYTNFIEAFDTSGNKKTCAYTLVVYVASSSVSAASSSSSNTAVIAGVVSAAGAIIFFILVLVLLARRRRMMQRPQDFNDILALMDDIVDDDGKTKVKPREINRDSLKIVAVLGKGNFGEVSKGYLQESRHIPSYLVAVKILHSLEATHVEKNGLLEEAALMAQFSHPHVVQLIGVMTAGDPIMVVLEYCEFGSLSSYLQKTSATETQKLILAGDCAEGLQYLHKKGCIHRDIAARNVLLNSELRAKISDFGMSRGAKENSDYYHSKGGALPVRWTAPEALDSRKFSAATDCWAYGILLYELWTNAATPYKDWGNPKVWMEVQNGYRLPCPEGCKTTIHAIMLQCWDVEPKKRPLFQRMAFFFRTNASPAENAYAARRTNEINSSGNTSVGGAVTSASSAFTTIDEINDAYVGLVREDGTQIAAADEFYASPHTPEPPRKHSVSAITQLAERFEARAEEAIPRYESTVTVGSTDPLVKVTTYDLATETPAEPKKRVFELMGFEAFEVLDEETSSARLETLRRSDYSNIPSTPTPPTPTMPVATSGATMNPYM